MEIFRRELGRDASVAKRPVQPLADLALDPNGGGGGHNHRLGRLAGIEARQQDQRTWFRRFGRGGQHRVEMILLGRWSDMRVTGGEQAEPRRKRKRGAAQQRQRRRAAPPARPQRLGGKVDDQSETVHGLGCSHHRSPVILHRREMVRGEPPFQVLKNDPFLAMEFERRWMELIVSSQFLTIGGAIDKDAHKKKYVVWQHDPYHYCLELLVERFVKWLSRHNFVGDVVIEARSKYADKRLKRAYHRVYQNGNNAITAEQAQNRLISGELKFHSKREDVAGLQLADSLAHPTLRYMKTLHLNEAPAVGFGAQLVEELVKSKLARQPKTGLITGWGLK